GDPPEVGREEKLIDAVDLRRLNRGVAVLGFTAAPGDLPIMGSVRDDRFFLGGAGVDGNNRAIDCRGRCETPRLVLGARILENIAQPDELAGAGVEAIELAFGAARVDFAVLKRRRRARDGAGNRL